MNVRELVKRIEQKIPLPPVVLRFVHIARVLVGDLIRCDLIKQAYAMAYVTLLSLVPSLAAVTCVAALFSPMLGPDSTLFDRIRTYFLENLAAGSGEAVVNKLEEMMAGMNLSSVGLTSFAVMLFTLILLLKQIEEALNRVWLVRKARNMFMRVMYFWTFMTLGMVAVALILSISGFSLENILSLTEGSGGEKGTFSGLLTLFAGFVFFFLLFKFVPNTSVRIPYAMAGALTAAVLLQQAGNLYGYYVSDFNNYQTLYGVLAALPLFLMWIYICWLIILLGAVISWRMQQGFPSADAEDTLDAAKLPKDRLRNVQVRAAMPTIALLAIHRRFAEGAGIGISPAEISEQLKLPIGWLGDALDALEAMGYVVRVQQSQTGGDITTANEAYFPSFPASSIKMRQLFSDLEAPLDEWVRHWRHDLPFDLSLVVNQWSGAERDHLLELDLAQAIEQLKPNPTMS